MERFALVLCLIAGMVIGALAQLLLSAPASSAPGAEQPSLADTRKPSLSALVLPIGTTAARPIGDLAHLQFSEPVADQAGYEDYLERHRYSKEALLGVFFLSREDAHLVEAARRYPDDPNVQLLVISKHLFPEARREWLERFKASQPENVIASILLGGDLLANGEIEAGLAEMRLAASQSGYCDFVVENCFAMEAALIELGRPAVETKMRSDPLAVFRHINPISQEIRRLEELAVETEDPEARAEIARVGLGIGRQLDSGEAGTRLINHLVGRSHINRFAGLLPPDESAAIAGDGNIRQQLDYYAELDARTGELNEQQYLHLLDRTRSQGGFEAMRWLSEQLGVAWEGADRWRE